MNTADEITKLCQEVMNQREMISDCFGQIETQKQTIKQLGLKCSAMSNINTIMFSTLIHTNPKLIDLFQETLNNLLTRLGQRKDNPGMDECVEPFLIPQVQTLLKFLEAAPDHPHLQLLDQD